MKTVLDEMNEVRTRNGQDPINPFQIQGFEGGDAPPLDWDRIQAANPASRLPEIDDPQPPAPAPPAPMTAEPVSPLVALGEAKDAPQPPPFRPGVLPPLDDTQVVVHGRQSSFRGQFVDLSDSEHAAIGRIILEAAQRRLRAQLDEVRKRAPRRLVAKKSEPSPPVVVPKKRGRPRKEKP